jgi:hypothetical protein
MSAVLSPEPPPATGEADYLKPASRQTSSVLPMFGPRPEPNLPAHLLGYPSTPAINEAVADVLAESDESVPKRGHNSFHNYDYVTADDLRLRVAKTLGKHGLSYQQHNAGWVPTGFGNMVEVGFWFILKHKSGEEWPPQWWPALTLMTSNKGGPDDKAVGKAGVLALKEWSKITFSIATGDMAEDPDFTDEPTPSQQTQKPSSARSSGSREAFRNAGLPPKVSGDPWLADRLKELAGAVNDSRQWLDLLTNGILPGCQTLSQVLAIGDLESVKSVRAESAKIPLKVRKAIEAAFTEAAKRIADASTDSKVASPDPPEEGTT